MAHPGGGNEAGVIEALHSLLDRKVPFLAGVRAVVALAYEPNGCDHLEGFGIFHRLNSMTAHIPDAALREFCTDGLLESSAAEERKLEAEYRLLVDAECRMLIARHDRRAV